MTSTKKEDDNKRAIDFMLAEYSLLKDFRDSALRQIESRLNFYFTSVSGVIAALAFVYELSGQSTTILITAVFLLLLLFWLGIMTFNRIVQGHISITRYTKGINLIRGYFVKNYKDIDKYITNPTSDNEPKFGNMGFVSVGGAPKINKIGLTAMTMLLNSFVITLLLLIVLQIAFQLKAVIAVLVGLLLFIFSLASHDSYVNKVVDDAKIAYEKDAKKR